MTATRVEAPQLVVPAGTPIAVPVSQLLYTGRAAIERLEIQVPPGPSGLVGFRFDHSSAQIIPKAPGTWIIADNRVVELVLDDLRPWPDWTIKAYNLDVYSHTLYVTVHLDDRVPVTPVPLTLVPIE